MALPRQGLPQVLVALTLAVCDLTVAQVTITSAATRANPTDPYIFVTGAYGPCQNTVTGNTTCNHAGISQTATMTREVSCIRRGSFGLKLPHSFCAPYGTKPSFFKSCLLPPCPSGSESLPHSHRPSIRTHVSTDFVVHVRAMNQPELGFTCSYSRASDHRQGAGRVPRQHRCLQIPPSQRQHHHLLSWRHGRQHRRLLHHPFPNRLQDASNQGACKNLTSRSSVFSFSCSAMPNGCFVLAASSLSSRSSLLFFPLFFSSASSVILISVALPTPNRIGTWDRCVQERTDP